MGWNTLLRIHGNILCFLGIQVNLNFLYTWISLDFCCLGIFNFNGLNYKIRTTVLILLCLPKIINTVMSTRFQVNMSYFIVDFYISSLRA